VAGRWLRGGFVLLLELVLDSIASLWLKMNEERWTRLPVLDSRFFVAVVGKERALMEFEDE